MPTATLGFALMCVPPAVLFLCLRDNWPFYILNWHLLRGFSHGGQRKLLQSPHLPVSLGPIKSPCILVGDSCLSLGREELHLPQPGRVLQAVATQPSHRRGVAALRPGKRKEDPVTLQGGEVLQALPAPAPCGQLALGSCGPSRALPG